MQAFVVKTMVQSKFNFDVRLNIYSFLKFKTTLHVEMTSIFSSFFGMHDLHNLIIVSPPHLGRRTKLLTTQRDNFSPW
jgi:hypothetical protein